MLSVGAELNIGENNNFTHLNILVLDIVTGRQGYMNSYAKKKKKKNVCKKMLTPVLIFCDVKSLLVY